MSQAVATISLNVLADDIPELAEKVTIVVTKVTTIGIIDSSRGAMIDPQRAQANLTIKANGSPYGVIGWHLDSQYFITPEPQSNSSVFNFVSFELLHNNIMNGVWMAKIAN